MSLEFNAACLAGRGRLARPRKSDSGHTGTISITMRACRTSWNVMKPRIQCVPTQSIPGFIAFGRRAGLQYARMFGVKGPLPSIDGGRGPFTPLANGHAGAGVKGEEIGRAHV